MIYLGSSCTNLISGMSACAGTGSTNCKETSNNSDGAQEGTWVGIAVGAWVALLVIVWFARTCSNRNRRRRALRTFGCLKKKVTDDPPGYNTIRVSNQTDRGSVYYTPSLPPTYEEILMRPSQYMVQSAAYGLYHQCGPGGHQVRLTLPCSGCLPNRYRNRSSRSSLSMLSISLATIEEEDRCDASQPPSPRRCDGDAEQTKIHSNGVHHRESRSAGLTFKIDYDNPADCAIGVQQKSNASDNVDNATNKNSNHDISDSDAHTAINESTFVDCYSEERTRPGDRSRLQHAPMLIMT
ncbi:unnamed protein product [Lymnaea stagnalis]|uniref:Uncharacterized protein n=1 Tax=Lymnaea stagnalis TaxID=6523 RepID=A0AAV2HH64_LYMST